MGHKRLAIESGEDPVNNPIEYILESIKTIYSIKHYLVDELYPDEEYSLSLIHISILNTLSFCLSISSAPIYTSHSIPKRAATVAVATPC